MSGYEVDTDRWRAHAHRVDGHAADVAGLAAQARSMVAGIGAYGLALAPLGLTVAAVQEAAAGAIGGLSIVLGASADAARAGAQVSEAVDEIVGATFRRVLR